MTSAELETILRCYPEAVRPQGPLHALGNAGGLSGACFWKFESAIGDTLLKAWPASFDDRQRLDAIDRWVDLANSLPYIPTPIRCQDGRSSVARAGRFWQVLPWMAGGADLSDPPASSHVESAFRGLASLHLRLARAPESGRGKSSGLRRRFREISTYLHGESTQLGTILGRMPESLSRTLALRWLEHANHLAPALRQPLEHASDLECRLQPCLRDARRDHFLFVGDDLTGIVDFGAMDVESVAGDLARLLGDWLIADRSGTLRRIALAAYEAIRPLDDLEHRLILLFEKSTALLAPEHWVRWHFLEGRVFEDPAAVEAGLLRGLTRLEAMLEEAGGMDFEGGQRLFPR